MVTITNRRGGRQQQQQATTRQTMESAQRIAVLAVIVLMFILALVNQRDNAEESILLLTASETKNEPASSVFDTTYGDDQRPDLSPWANCTIDSSIPSSQPEGLKAFWVPMYPNSDGGIIGNLIRLLTNSPNGHKNYYASAPGLKKCKATGSITISCEQIHPIVGIGPPPERQLNMYQKKILLGMRHPLTGVPAHHHNKAVKYHGATSQVDIDEWRMFRDQYFTLTVHDGWRRVLSTWKELDGYDTEPFYLPYEHMLDVTKGPILTEQLAKLLRTAGYNVVATNDIPCAWYNAVQDQLSSPRHPQYDYADHYIPSLTSEQKLQLIAELNDIRTTYPTDQSLSEILFEYIAIVENEPRTDIEYVNQTRAAADTGGGH